MTHNLFALKSRGWLVTALVGCALGLAVLACQGDATNMAVKGIPKYVCPSATPRPTDTPPPPDPPTYPPAFGVTLDYGYVDTSRSVVTVQYLAQNAGTVSLLYSEVMTDGTAWSGNVVLAVTGNSSGVQGSFPITFPLGLQSAQLVLSSSVFGSNAFTIVAYSVPMFSTPTAPPCCLAAPIYPTARPTYTPYPTPTPFQIQAPAPFYLDDAVYNYQPPVQLRLRLRSPIREGLLRFIIPLLGAATWTLEITNVGSVEYDFLGAGYTYVSSVVLPSGSVLTGVWPPSHEAATFLGIQESAYGPQALQPGQTVSVIVAAWIPITTHVNRVSLLLDPYHSGDPGWATFAPGAPANRTTVQWANMRNPYCSGEIAYP